MSKIQVNEVTKKYADHTALDRMCIEIPERCIYGLLGPNGAGKTTLIRILNQITAPDSGEVLINGEKLSQKHIARIGYLPEERGLYKKMKVGEQAIYLAELKGIKKAEAQKRLKTWFEKFEIGNWWDKKVEELSKGMQQKVQFIVTIIHEPKLLIFDEPFSGFDPINVNLLKNEILELRDNGATILFSTHNMESVEAICERITLINHSRVVLEGLVDEIRQQHKQGILAVELPKGDALEANDALYTILPPQPGEHEKRVRLNEGVTMHDAIAWLNDHCNLCGFHEILPSMHDIFINTVKDQNHEQA